VIFGILFRSCSNYDEPDFTCLFEFWLGHFMYVEGLLNCYCVFIIHLLFF